MQGMELPKAALLCFSYYFPFTGSPGSSPSLTQTETQRLPWVQSTVMPVPVLFSSVYEKITLNIGVSLFCTCTVFFQMYRKMKEFLGFLLSDIPAPHRQGMIWSLGRLLPQTPAELRHETKLQGH